MAWMALNYNDICLFIELMVWLSQTLISAKELESTFVITSGCASPGDTLTLDCSVRLLQSGGSIVWRGTAFDCPSNEITILYRNFMDNQTMVKTCNNGSIVASNLGIKIDSDSRTYTSQLNVLADNSGMLIGKNITCEHDDGVRFNPGSMKLIKTEKDIHPDVGYEVDDSEKRIIFTWNQSCSAISHYDIQVSNCGSCPTTTNHTTITCTNVPTDAERCLFILIPANNLNAGTIVDVELRQMRGFTQSKFIGMMAACILLTITTVTLLTLISIALMFRFKRTLPSLHRSSPNAYTDNQTMDIRRSASQYEEIGIYSHLHDNQEINDRVVKTFDNDGNGVYSVIDDAGCQEKVKGAGCSSGDKFQSSNEASASAVYSQVGGPLNMDNLLITFGGTIKSQWWKFGLALGVPRCVLSQLSGEDTRCIKVVLDHWLKHHPGQPTWAEIAEAQKKVQFQTCKGASPMQVP